MIGKSQMKKKGIKRRCVTSINPWENHTPKASYCDGRAQILIRPPFKEDLPDVRLVTLPPPSKANVPTAALGDTPLSNASLEHGQLFHWSEPFTGPYPPQVAFFRLASSQ